MDWTSHTHNILDQKGHFSKKQKKKNKKKKHYKMDDTTSLSPGVYHMITTYLGYM